MLCGETTSSTREHYLLMIDPISIGLGYGAWKLGKFIYDKFNESATPLDSRKEAEIRELTAEPIYFAVAVLAKFAKADGVVSKNEIATIESILRDIELTGEDRTKAIRIFTAHKGGALTYEESLSILAVLAEDDIDFRVGICILLLRLAHADGLPSNHSIKGVQYACEVMGIDYSVIYQSFIQQKQQLRESLNADYDILGCSPNDPPEKIKQRYRELTKTFHPDTMSGKDVHPEITKLAVEKFHQIQSAFERINSQPKPTKSSQKPKESSSSESSSNGSCPKCGHPLGEGVTRCWTKGCKYVLPKAHKA